MTPAARNKITPPQLARAWGISTDKVLAWVRSGELPALNAATKIGQRPRYLVDLADLEAFEQRRTVIPVAGPRPRLQKRKGGYIEFF